jgi:hypothetical protein
VQGSRHSGAGNRGRGPGRPKIDRELRELIRRMSKENPKWGASRIHGELLMLGFAVAQSTVSKYMVQGGSPSQGWKTFFRNHAQAIAAIDLFVVPTLTFERLFAFRVLGHGRRQLAVVRGDAPSDGRAFAPPGGGLSGRRNRTSGEGRTATANRVGRLSWRPHCPVVS